MEVLTVHRREKSGLALTVDIDSFRSLGFSLEPNNEKSFKTRTDTEIENDTLGVPSMGGGSGVDLLY